MGLFKNGQASLLGQSAPELSSRINTGMAVNHLRADCSGDELSIHVNGQQLSDVHDLTLTHGDARLLAGAFDQPGVDIAFDNCVVLKPC